MSEERQRTVSRDVMRAVFERSCVLERAACDCRLNAENLQHMTAHAVERATAARDAAEQQWAAALLVMRAWAADEVPSTMALAHALGNPQQSLLCSRCNGSGCVACHGTGVCGPDGAADDRGDGQ